MGSGGRHDECVYVGGWLWTPRVLGNDYARYQDDEQHAAHSHYGAQKWRYAQEAPLGVWQENTHVKTSWNKTFHLKLLGRTYFNNEASVLCVAKVIVSRHTIVDHILLSLY